MDNLLYITHSRPDLDYAIGVVAIYMQEPHDIHCNAAKRILHYMQGTKHLGIHYAASSPLELVGFFDLDLEIPLTRSPLQVMYSCLHMVPYSGQVIK